MMCMRPCPICGRAPDTADPSHNDAHKRESDYAALGRRVNELIERKRALAIAYADLERDLRHIADPVSLDECETRADALAMMATRRL